MDSLQKLAILCNNTLKNLIEASYEQGRRDATENMLVCMQSPEIAQKESISKEEIEDSIKYVEMSIFKIKSKYGIED